jgi:hypothetical protein
MPAAGLADGTYKLYTADAAGNLSAASSNTFTVDSTPPTFSSSSPLSIAKTTIAGSAGDSPGETITLTINITRVSINFIQKQNTIHHLHVNQ